MKKKFFSIILVLALLVSMFVPANAASLTATSQQAADSLYQMGLFKGTDTGYELSKTPTRIQLLVMLVRFLGTEKAAQSGSFYHPYNDLSSWHIPYVGYAYNKGITNGTSSKAFSPDQTATLQQYCAMLLRALGYTEAAGDFTYDKAYDKALAVGLFQSAGTPGSAFTRADMVNMSYSALSLIPKGKSDVLIVQLVNAGAVDKTAAIGAGFQRYFPADSGNTTTSGNAFRIGTASLIIGQSKDSLITALGQPNRIDASQYDFSWYVYHSDYHKFIMVGVANNVVTAFYSNSSGVSYGSLIVGKAGGTAPTNSSVQVKTFTDNFSNNALDGILVLKTGLTKKSYTAEIMTAMERQNLDLTNVARVNHGLSPLSWSDIAAQTARAHSADMGAKNYFAHNNLSGLSPFDRMKANGISYKAAAENIAAGQSSIFEAHHGWMNSDGHRKNILNGSLTNLGVGIAYNSSSTYGIYYTQDFFTP